MGGPGPAQFVFVKRKIKKYFWNFTIFPCIFYVILLNIGLFVFVILKKNTNLVLKYPIFIQKHKKF